MAEKVKEISISTLPGAMDILNNNDSRKQKIKDFNKYVTENQKVF